MASDHDLELLETYLDGELPPGEADALRERLDSDRTLPDELERLRATRSLRLAALSSFEPDDAALTRVLDSTRRLTRPPRGRYFRRLAYGLAAAACLTAAVLVGAGLVGNLNPHNRASAQPVYHVELRDESGEVIGVQKFQSLDKAREFSDDIRQWQQRQERLLQGERPTRSAEF